MTPSNQQESNLVTKKPYAQNLCSSTVDLVIFRSDL